MIHAIINGDLVAANSAALPINDLALQRGYGIFDFFKVLNSKPIFLEDHLDRFYYSAGQMGLPVGYDRAGVKALLQLLLEKDKTENAGVKLLLTGGCSSDGYTLGKPNLVMVQYPLVMGNALADAPLRLITYPHQRQMSHIKTIDYLMAIWLQPHIKEQGADDVLYHSNGAVSECPRSNFFIVTPQGTIATPNTNILRGVTRKQVLQHLSAGLLMEERPVLLEEVFAAREVFVTSSVKNVFPVTMVDGKPIGDGKPGAITLALAEKFGGLMKRDGQQASLQSTIAV